MKEKINKSETILNSWMEAYYSIPKAIRVVFYSVIGIFSLTIAVGVGKNYFNYKDLKNIKEIIDDKLKNKEKEQISIEDKIIKIKNLIGEECYKYIPNNNIYIEEIKVQKKGIEPTINNFSLLDISFHSLKIEDEYLANIDTIEKRFNPEISEKEDKPISVSNLVCGKDTLPAEVFHKILEQTYPKNWINSEITEIKQENMTEEIPKSYGINDDQKAWALTNDNSKIIFFEPSFRFNFSENINTAFSHEAGHCNSWECINNLSIEQRLDFLLYILDRVQSEDRYLSSYVESINSEDKKNELYNKATEYWAVICEVYFSGNIQNLNIKDIQIIETIIKTKDPNFDVYKALQKRTNSLNFYGNKIRDEKFYQNNGGIIKL
ncbi:MAG: hypothetical protein WDK96_01960 [Candidatus Paceibacterota bacterium]|jgi:hypothetical protein